MTVRIQVIAKIDARVAIEAIQLPALKDAEISAAVVVEFGDHTFGCDTLEEAVALVKEMARQKQLPSTSRDSQ